MAPEMDSAENPWFTNSANVIIQILISEVTAVVWFVFAVFDCKDAWWQTVMGFQLFPPGVTSWNVLKNKGIVAYGDVIENEMDYETFYNLREDAPAE